jgi:hypothetical protein
MNAHTMHYVDPSKRSLVDKHGRSRTGAYMHVSNGGKYWPFDPRPDEIFIDAIAHQLATSARWQGATQHRRFKSRIFYSVAEHSVYVARDVRLRQNRPDLALEALLHDAPEYVIGDLIRPLKYDPAFHAPFKAVEELNERAVAEKFNLVYPWPKEIKLGDEAVCQSENAQIVPRNADEEWQSGLLHDDTVDAGIEIQMLEPYPAKELFLLEYHRIIQERDKYRALPADFRV